MNLFFLGRVSAAALALGTLLLFTRLLEPEDFGYYNIVVIAGTVAQSLCLGWLVVAIPRFQPVVRHGGAALPMAVFASAVLLGLLVPATLLVAAFLPDALRATVAGVAAFAAGHALHELGLMGLRVQRRGPLFLAVALGRPLIGVTLATALVLEGGHAIEVVAAVVVGALLAGGVALATAIKRSGITRPSLSMMRQMFAYGLPLAVVRTSAMLFTLTAQSQLAFSHGLAAVGYFAAAQTLTQRSIAMLMATLGTTTSADIFLIYETDGSARARDALRRHMADLLLVSVPLLITMMAAGRAIAVLVFDARFAEGISLHLPILALAAFIGGFQAGFLSFSFSITRRTRLQLYVLAGALGAHLAGTWLLLRVMGPVGASWAVLVTATVSAGAYAWHGRRFLIEAMPRKPIRQMGRAALLALPVLISANFLHTLGAAVAAVVIGNAILIAALLVQDYPSLRAVRRRLHA